MAVLALAAFVAGASYGLWKLNRRGEEIEQLRAAAQDEFREKHYAAAMELFHALALQEFPTAEERFQLAQCLAALGRRSEARQIVEEMVSLAGTDWLPHSARVYPDLHFWLAQEIYSRPNVTTSQWKAVEDHLQTVLERSPQHETARRMLLAISRAAGNRLEALGHLEKLAGISTADRMELALAYAEMGKIAPAAEEAELVLATLLLDLSENPDNLELRNQAARAAMLAGDFATAEQQLKLALMYGKGDVSDTTARLAEVYERQAAAVPHDRPDWDRQALELLRRSLDFAPRRLKTYEALKPLLQRPGEVGTEAHELLVIGLARGVEPAWVHGLLAESAARAGRAAESVLHWRAVVASQPTSTVALNNLAWELCWSDSPELDDALMYIEQALRQAPYSAALRETRGQILARAGRSREALADLLSAVSEFRDNARLHATLSEVYKDLELPEESALHAKRAAELAPETRFVPLRAIKKTEETRDRPE